MKTIIKMKKQLLLLAMMLLPMMAMADKVEVNGIYFNLDEEKKTAEVTWGDWDLINLVKGDGRYAGEIFIPANIEAKGTVYKVISIGISAFLKCEGLQSVVISEGLEEIKSCAFEDCENLSSVILPKTVTYIGNVAFYNCKRLESIILPANLKQIDYAAFSYTSIKSIVIPKSVTNIEGTPFSYCPKLKSIVVEDGNLFFDSRKNCNGIVRKSDKTLIQGISTTIIPDDINTIGEGAFAGQSKLETIYIPNQITTISEWAFLDCDGLVSIILPNSILELKDHILQGCKSLTSVNLPQSLEYIGGFAFSGCSSLESISLPSNLKKIDGGAFGGTGLKSITIPKSVISLYGPFGDGKSLESIIVEDGNMYYDSRENCNAIINTETNTLVVGCKNTTIPNNVTSISGGAFSGCIGLSAITIPHSVTTIGDDAFMDCNSLSSISLPNSITTIGIRAFCGSGLESIFIPKSVTTIDTWAFALCNMSSIVVEEGNPKYDSRENCDAIIETESNTIIAGCNMSTYPTNVCNIGYGAFTGSYSRDTLTIPDHITNIGTYAYGECNFTTVILGRSISKIQYRAFTDCPQLTNVLCYAEKIPSTAKTVFDGCKSIKEGTLYVPSSLIEEYRSRNPWNTFKQILPLSVSTVRSVRYNSDKEYIYSISGKKLNSFEKGINIIQMSDGSIKKVIMK